MIMIDVLNKLAKGEIRKGTKLIVDFSYEQDSPETYTYNGERFDVLGYGASTETLNAEVKLIEPQLYYCKMPNSKRILGFLGQYKKLVFEQLPTFQGWYPNATYLFTHR